MKRKQTAAVYDRWLSTLGGGEQVAFAYARALSELGYKVELLTHKKFNLQKAAEKMAVSFKNISVKFLPEYSSLEVSGYSEKYDVFINTSHLDYFPNRSKNGFLSVFFPGKINLSFSGYIKRAIVIPLFQMLFIYPSNYEGFAYDQYVNEKILKWLSHESAIVFKDKIGYFEIELYFPDLTFSVIDAISFSLNETELQYKKRKINPHKNTITYGFMLNKEENQRFTITLPDNEYSEKVALTTLTIPDLRFMLYNIFKHIFPVWEMRLHGGPSITKSSDLMSYKKIITISQFCRKWIRRYWKLDAEVLYPPVNTKSFFSAKQKKNIILHVGRFFVTGHSKKQLELVAAFKKLSKKKGTKDWELHFVGSLAEGKTHQEYLHLVQSQAVGHKIFFHINSPHEELRKLFSEAKLYWHATGFGENEEEDPILFEHFGITTVEAMASGCVPVVINAGGQKEIVKVGTGFKWDSIDELVNYSLQLIKDKKLLKACSLEAIKRSKYFSQENFKLRFAKLVLNK